MLPNLNPFKIDNPGLLSIDKSSLAAGNIIEHAGFNPYQDNGGNVVAVSGNDYCVIAADTRLSVGFSIISRNTSKVSKLTENCYLLSAGMYADLLALRKHLQAKIVMYQFDNGREPSVDAIGHLVQQTLYSKRFFPFYCWVLLAGLDENGKGVVVEYDPVGTIEHVPYSARGSANELINPSLDAVFKGSNQLKKKLPETKEETAEILRDFFNSAAERDIYTGDAVEIIVLQKGKVTQATFPLRKD